MNEYAPTTGVKELRQAVANLYNKEYRQGMKSQYTYENVCIVSRKGLTVVEVKGLMSMNVDSGWKGRDG